MSPCAACDPRVDCTAPARKCNSHQCVWWTMVATQIIFEPKSMTIQAPHNADNAICLKTIEIAYDAHFNPISFSWSYTLQLTTCGKNNLMPLFLLLPRPLLLSPSFRRPAWGSGKFLGTLSSPLSAPHFPQVGSCLALQLFKCECFWEG